MANKANLANSVLFAPLSDSDTELEVYTGDGSLFPDAPFYLTLSPKNKWSRKINSEIVLVTAKSGDIFTITRAQKDTTAKEFSYGDLIANGIYVEDLDDTVDEAVSAALQAMMPVGFVVTLGVSTNPATLYGFGTWTRIQGRVVVGVSDSDTDFDLNDTGGAKTHTLTSGQLPVMSWGWSSIVPGSYQLDIFGTGGITGDGAGVSSLVANVASSSPANAWKYKFNVGGGQSHNIMQPYVAKYVWERTA
jgi:hypothetical protein